MMICPECGGEMYCERTFATHNTVVRRIRVCKLCGARRITIERVKIKIKRANISIIMPPDDDD